MAPSHPPPQPMSGVAAPSFRPAPAGPRIRERLSLRARRGDQRAFEEIFYRHHQEIYRYCLAIVRNPSDAEDALQATMSAAMRALPGERREVELRPWLYRVAHNEAISILRGRREQVSIDEEQPEGASSSAAEEAEGRQRLRTLVSDLQSLPERQRSALVMRELSDLSYGEIATVLSCAEGSARQTVYEARMALKGQAEGREMQCEEARHAINDGDGRRLRGRLLKAHLAGCGSCADFQAAISARSGDLRVLCPALPVAAAGGVLAGLVGGVGGAATGAGGAAAVGSGAAGGAGALGGGAAGAVAIKAASVMAAVAITAGAADVGGVVELPGPLHIGGAAKSEQTPSAAGKPGSSEAQEARAKGVEASSLKGGNGSGKGQGMGSGQGQGSGRGSPQGKGQGQGQGQPNHGAGNPGNGPANANPNSNAGGGGPPAVPPGQINKPPTGGGKPAAPGKPPASPGGGNSGGQPPAGPPATPPGKGGPPPGKGGPPS